MPRRTILLALALLTTVTAVAEPNGIVSLLTDYGIDSVYVGIIKGAIYNKYPSAKVDSITNGVPPFDIRAGAYLLAEGCQSWPKGTVFCCIVDPGVGTARKPVAVETKNGFYFVAPDNGILTLVADQYGIKEARECTNESLWRGGDLSTTFHGRDIFGPVAAALAGGTPLAEVGDKLDVIVRLDLPKSRREDGAVSGIVIRADDYGNLVTNIRRDDLEALGIRKGDRLDIAVGDQRYTAPFASTYGDVPQGERLVVVQSSGFIELAINMDSLAKALGVGLHAPVTLKKASTTP